MTSYFVVLASPALLPFGLDPRRAEPLGTQQRLLTSLAGCRLPLAQINTLALGTFSSLICSLKPEMFLVVTVNTHVRAVGTHTALLLHALYHLLL